MKISGAVHLATRILHRSGVAQPEREASSLLAFAIHRDRAFLIAHPEYELTAEEESRFASFVARRSAREPFQYIVGRQEFYRLEFDVSPDVLIPRPETEALVESAIETLSGSEHARFCEVGIGSGCISVSVLHELSAVSAVGLDISEPALRVARGNAEKHAVSRRLSLHRSDVFDSLPPRTFDLIVTNPPYIPDDDLAALQVEVRSYEPRPALAGGSDGLVIVRRIVSGSPGFLKPGGFLLMEIGFDQSKRVGELFSTETWEPVEFLPDLQGIPRVVKAHLRELSSP